MSGAAGAAAPSLLAPITFLDGDRLVGTPTNYFSIPPPPGVPARLPTRKVTVPVHDARALASAGTSWEREGFVLAAHPEGVVADFHDEALLAGPYEESVRRLVCALTGARRAVVFDRTHRSSAITARPGAGPDMVVDEAHNDYTASSGPDRVREMLPKHAPDEDLAQALARRHAILNVWRPTNGVVEQWPLAVCDRTTIERDDLVDAELRYANRTGHVAVLRHHRAQRWYYVPRMGPAEALAFTCYDSALPDIAWGAHTAFADPTTPPGARVRESLETRVIALF
jgi:hypothetical protein